MTVYSAGGQESIVNEVATASQVTYDPTTSGLAATDVQAAVDEAVGRIPVIIYATANQDKTADTTLAADAVLVVPLEASSQYVIEIEVYGDTNATADWNADCNYTGTLASVHWTWDHTTVATSGVAGGTASSTTLQVIMGSGINQSHAVANTGTQTNRQRFLYRVQTTTAGTFQYRWAQTVASGTSTRRKDSFIRAQKVG